MYERRTVAKDEENLRDEAEDENGNDDSFSEFFIDQYPQVYTPSKDIVIARKIVDVPEPYQPERSNNHDRE